MINTIEALYGEDWFPCSIIKISTKFDSQIDGRIFVEVLSTVPDKNDSYWQDCIPHTRLRIDKTTLSREKFFSFMEGTPKKKATTIRRKRPQEITTRTRRNKKVKTTCGFVFPVEEIEKLIKTYYRDVELAKKSNVIPRSYMILAKKTPRNQILNPLYFRIQCRFITSRDINIEINVI